jgi:glycosyltransferase involved in cell wall biosynthesis
VLFQYESPTPVPKVTVVVPLYNYEKYIVECLDSVCLQTAVDLDLIVDDDCSLDHSTEKTLSWMETNARRFRRCQLLRNTDNLRLARTRNRLFQSARTEYVFPLDADNTIYPRCLETLESALDHCEADFAYCILERFGVEQGLVSWRSWDPQSLLEANYIDAMAMVRRATWERVGGYSTDMPVMGCEDFEFWLKIAAVNGWGILVPEVLARYRVHLSSMIHTETLPRVSQIWEYLKYKHRGIRPPDARTEELTRLNDELILHCDRVRLIDKSADARLLQISGWALARSAVAQIEIVADGQELGTARYGDLRPELGNRVPGYRDRTRCGFSFQAEIPDPGGEGTFIVLRATSTAGRTSELRIMKSSIASPLASQQHDRTHILGMES